MNKRLRSFIRRLVESLPPRFQTRLESARKIGRRPVRGQNSFIHGSVQILGKAHVQLGTNSVLSQDCWLNVNHRDLPGPSIEIGDNCFIGRRNFFSSGAGIKIGHFVLTANDCQFLGSTHHVNNPLVPVIATGTTQTDTIVIGANTFIGAGATVVGDVRIGHGCVIGAGSLVTRPIPPFSQAHGNPAVIRKRYSFARAQWLTLDQFSAGDELSQPGETEYVALLRTAPAVRMPYLACGADMGNC